MVPQGLVPNDLGVILAEVVGQIADGVVELVGLRLEIGGDLGHVLDRLDLDLRVLLVPGTGLGALEPIAHGRDDRPEAEVVLGLADLAGLRDFREGVVRAAPARVARRTGHEIEAVVVLEVGPGDFDDLAGLDLHAILVQHCPSSLPS